jgi:hypothetical protein
MNSPGRSLPGEKLRFFVDHQPAQILRGTPPPQIELEYIDIDYDTGA